MWRRFERMYARAQGVLTETLTRPPDAPVTTGRTTRRRPAPLAMLRQAELETVVVVKGAPAAGKLIRELHLRRKTGASVVGIERAGKNIVNPGPEEQLHVGDGVMLLGNRKQLEAARPLLRGEPVGRNCAA